MKKAISKRLSFLLAMIMFMSLLLPMNALASGMPSTWAQEQVAAAISSGLVPQGLQSQYTQTTTRAEFTGLAVAVYEKVTGKEIAERTKFDDTTDTNIEKAAAVGIVNGTGNNSFSPNTGLTREQAATMLSRLAEAVGKPLTKQTATFADNGDISSWALDAVGQIQAAEIMGGVGNNTFSPKGDYTREQSIITVLRLYDYVTTPASSATTELAENLTVHFIDVGQADSILIELPNSQSMLIDGGNRADGTTVINYLRDKGISTINYLVATHPHEDHIGGLPDVIGSSINVESIYMPRVETTTQIFEELLTSIDSKGLSINTAQSGVAILSTPDLQIDIVAPVGSSYADLNDWSAVVKLKYKDTVFLFMGDAETASTNQITADIDADVIKIGHHGSESSATASFLQKVTPDYAVICVGEGNTYGHPDDSTLAALNENGVDVFRTDEQGTIIITSDGENISVDKQPVPYNPNAPPSTTTTSPTTTTTTTTRPPTTTTTRSPTTTTTTPPTTTTTQPPTTTTTPPTTTTTTTPPTTIAPTTAPAQNQSITVYVTRTGEKYHRDGCRYLSQSKIPISLDVARRSYGPCSVCNPPR